MRWHFLSLLVGGMLLLHLPYYWNKIGVIKNKRNYGEKKVSPELQCGTIHVSRTGTRLTVNEGSAGSVGWQIVPYTCKQAWSTCDPWSRQTLCLHGEWHWAWPPVESLNCFLCRISKANIKLCAVLLERHGALCLFSLAFIILLANRCWCWGDKWSYVRHENQPRGFFPRWDRKYQAAVTMIDGLVTELCKSSNPFIKLNRGALDALYLITSAHLASVNDTLCCQVLREPWQEPMTRGVERFYVPWWVIVEIHTLYSRYEANTKNHMLLITLILFLMFKF